MPGSPLPRIIWVEEFIISDGTGVATIEFNAPVLISGPLLLDTGPTLGPTNNILFPAVAVPSLIITGQEQAGDPIDVDWVQIEAWLPLIRGASGEWIGWGHFRPEHVA